MIGKLKFSCDLCGSEVGLKATKCEVCGASFTNIKCPDCQFTGTPQQFQNGCPRCNKTNTQTEPRNLSAMLSYLSLMLILFIVPLMIMLLYGVFN